MVSSSSFGPCPDGIGAFPNETGNILISDVAFSSIEITNPKATSLSASSRPDHGTWSIFAVSEQAQQDDLNRKAAVPEDRNWLAFRPAFHLTLSSVNASVRRSDRPNSVLGRLTCDGFKVAVEVPEQHFRRRPRDQASDPSHTRHSVDKSGLGGHQGLPAHAHDQTSPSPAM